MRGADPGTRAPIGHPGARRRSSPEWRTRALQRRHDTWPGQIQQRRGMVAADDRYPHAECVQLDQHSLLRHPCWDVVLIVAVYLGARSARGLWSEQIGFVSCIIQIEGVARRLN